jgi:hypothetical protein
MEGKQRTEQKETLTYVSAVEGANKYPSRSCTMFLLIVFELCPHGTKFFLGSRKQDIHRNPFISLVPHASTSLPIALLRGADKLWARVACIKTSENRPYELVSGNIRSVSCS